MFDEYGPERDAELSVDAHESYAMTSETNADTETCTHCGAAVSDADQCFNCGSDELAADTAFGLHQW